MAGFPLSDETFPEEDAEAISLVERYFGISFGPMESLAELPKDEQLAFMLEQAKSAGLVPAELDVSQARRFVELLRNDLRATQNYGLRLYPGESPSSRRAKCRRARLRTRRWAGANGPVAEWRSTSFRAITPI